MKRFSVTNKADGRKFMIEADALPDPLPPEWGRPARNEEGQDGEPVAMPAEYEIIEEDITAEVVAREAAKTAQAVGLVRIRELGKKAALTGPEINEAVKLLLQRY